MFANKNNLRSELTANVGVLDTSISITSGEWILWENNMVACLEHYENEICTKREIIKITAKNNNTFTITRGFAVCIMNDQTKQQGQWSQTFSVWDFLSLYLSKELWESISWNIAINENALQTMLWHITAPETCINDNCLSRKNSIDSAYNTKYWWNAWFWNASDGDFVITTSDLDEHWYFYLGASREYNFNNLTICPGVTVRFLGSGVPTINVRNNFKNFGCIELKAWFVSNSSQTDCRLERGCEICNGNTDRGLYQGWRWWAGGWNWSQGQAGSPWSFTSGWAGWTGWQGCPWNPADWMNGWKGGCWKSSNNCNGGWWWWGGGGWWLYWNGGDWWDGWFNGLSQTYGWEWWKGWNSWLFGRAWNGGAEWWAHSWNGWKGGDGWDWRIGGDWYSVWSRTSDQAGVGWKWILQGWTGWSASWSYYWWNGGDAITNVYWFHLNARNIWNNYVDARWWNGWTGGATDYWQSWNGWNGANGWQMIISYDTIHEQGCFDVRGGCGGEPWHVRRPSCWWTSWSYGTPGSDWRVVFHSMNYPYISNFNLENDSDNEAILISWKDPQLKQSAPNPRKKTIIRVSTTNFPASITDWTLVVEETTKNQYKTNPYSMSATDGVTYYFTAFAIAQDDTIIDTQSKNITPDFDWKPSADTYAYYKLETDLNDYSWNSRNLTATASVSYITSPKAITLDANKYLYRNSFWFAFNTDWTFNVRIKITWFWWTSWWNAMHILSEWTASTRKCIFLWIYNWRSSWQPQGALQYARYFEDKVWSAWNVPLNTWCNVIYTYQSSTRNYRAFVNWVQVMSWTFAWVLSVWNTNLVIGANATNTSDITSRIIWNMARYIVETKTYSLSDAQSYFNKTKSKFWL